MTHAEKLIAETIHRILSRPGSTHTAYQARLIAEAAVEAALSGWGGPDRRYMARA